MTDAARPQYRVLITDLDNTLWDWFGAWFKSFDAMLERLTALSGVPRSELEAEIRDIHRLRHTTEYSNLVNEIPALVSAARGEDPSRFFHEALHVLRSTRRAETRLYPAVLETLRMLRERGIRVIAYTESVAYWTEWRIKYTGLDGMLDVLYSAPDHDLPTGMTRDNLRHLSADSYGLRMTEHRHIPREATKPNVAVLRSILADAGIEPEQAVYIGDSLMKDVAMAQAAGVLDVHAAYGEAQAAEGYDLLRRVSHWSDSEIQRERTLFEHRETITPSVVCESGFHQILSVFDLKGIYDRRREQ